MNLIKKIFSKKPASEQKLGTTKQILPNQEKVQIQVKQETKTGLSLLICSGCKKKYVIGKNAVAVCLETAGQHLNALVVYDTIREDLVAPIDPSNKEAFERAKPGWETIQNSLLHGQQRQWKCNICNLVNKYPDLSLDNSDSESTENTSEKGISDSDIIIGNQVWMAENLNVDKFRNGDPIPEAKTNKEWKKAGVNKQPAWCFYDNDPAYGLKYGKLYNGYAVKDSRGLAPQGWHIPTDAEWTILTDYLERELKAFKIKIYTEGGKDSDISTYKSGFSYLLGGMRYTNGEFNDVGSISHYWSSSESDTWAYWTRVYNYGRDVSKFFSGWKGGLSIRCLRD